MTKKCTGCGAILQTESLENEGYIQASIYDTSLLCERCFKIRNYGEYKRLVKKNADFLPILGDISKTKDLVILVIDLFNIPKSLHTILEHISNPVLLVLTKRDILPLSVSDEKLLNYSKNFTANILDSIIISSFKNYNFDFLFDKIKKYKKSNNVYVVGYTNAGKSTMINKIIYNYFDKCTEVTTSMLPSTTLNTIEITLDGLTLIDTPGLLDEGNMAEYVDYKMLKKITPKKEIKPITYQIKAEQTIFIEDLVRIDTYTKGSMTFYISNALKVERTFKKQTKMKDLQKTTIEVASNEDIVISGVGFIKCVSSGRYDIYTYHNVEVFTRPNLI